MCASILLIQLSGVKVTDLGLQCCVQRLQFVFHYFPPPCYALQGLFRVTRAVFFAALERLMSWWGVIILKGDRSHSFHSSQFGVSKPKRQHPCLSVSQGSQVAEGTTIPDSVYLVSDCFPSSGAFQGSVNIHILNFQPPQQFLQFAIENRHYRFMALLFGLSTAQECLLRCFLRFWGCEAPEESQ